MSQTIEVLLIADNEKDSLIFKIDEKNPNAFQINLNSDSNQMQIKEVFSKLLEILIEQDIVLELVVDANYTKGLYKDVCKEYIKELNAEIENVKHLIREKLK